jgi:hypothetical protein
MPTQVEDTLIGDGRVLYSDKSYRVQYGREGVEPSFVTWENGRVRHWKTHEGALQWRNTSFLYWAKLHEAKNHEEWYTAFTEYLYSNCPDLGPLRDRAFRVWKVLCKDKKNVRLELRQFKIPLALRVEVLIRVDSNKKKIATYLLRVATNASRELTKTFDLPVQFPIKLDISVESWTFKTATKE